MFLDEVLHKGMAKPEYNQSVSERPSFFLFVGRLGRGNEGFFSAFFQLH
jgi:hypothetical protein